jgi:uncharacterized membrane protein YciS (DUF1049 family)
MTYSNQLTVPLNLLVTKDSSNATEKGVPLFIRFLVCCYIFLGSHIKMKKYKKNKKIKRYSEEIQKNNSSEKRMLECL